MTERRIGRPPAVIPNLPELAARYEAGESVVSLAKGSGFNAVTIWKRLRAIGVEMRSQTPDALAARLWTRVNKTEGCWLWTGPLDAAGYGHIGRGGRIWVVHRYIYEREVGPVPPGFVVCHRCDVRNCVRPDHLFVGTQADNMRDCKVKGRTAHSERHRDARLTTADVYDIRRRYDSGETLTSIAADYSTSSGHVCYIGQRKKWAHLPEQKAG